MIRPLILAAALAFAACTPGTNTTGTPTNASEQAAASLYGGYIAADTAYLAALTAGKVSKTAIAAIEPKRVAARAALDQFAAASKQGNTAAASAAAQIAISALTTTLTANGIAVQGN